MTLPLPAGFGLEADRDLRVVDRGRVLVGGAPLRILRLTPPGAALVRGWLRGAAVGPDTAEATLARRLVEIGMAHPVVPPQPMVPAPTVTVVVPVHDDPDGVARTLDALHAGDDPGEDGRPAVVIVDDGSSEPARLAAAVAGRAQVLRRAGAGGPGAARTAGVAHVTSDVVAFVDAAVELRPAALQRLLDHLADPQVVAVAPRVVSGAGGGRWARYEQRHSPLDMGPRPAPVRVGSPVPYVPTACLVVRRSALVEAGGFDLGLRYGEDVDLVWRLSAAGGAVRYDPSITAVHPPRPDLAAFVRQRVGYGTSAGPLAQRHGSDVAPVRCSGWSVAVWALAVSGHPGLAVAVGAWTARALRPKLAALPEPTVEAARLTAIGHWWAARQLSAQLARTWWPLTAVACLSSRWRRRLVPVALVASIAGRWPGAGGSRWETALLGLVDDVAYGTGVWRGLGRRGTARAVLPGLVSWPVRDARTGRAVTGR